jgi:hypothetical protein
MYEGQGFQKPTSEGLEELVLDTFVRMNQRLDETRHLVRPSRFYELRYEDLVADPIGQLRAVYEHLELDGFESVAPAIAAYQAARADYKTKRYQQSAEERDKIEQRWGEYIRRHGYAAPSNAPS